MMNTIFSEADLPERRLVAHSYLNTNPNMNVGGAIARAKHSMARQIGEKIMEKDNFFMMKSDQVAGISMLEIWGNCYVLTEKELFDLQREAFRKGAEHARGYVSVSPT